MRDDGGAAPVRLVSVVDDDVSVRESLPELLGEFGFQARAFASAHEFLSSEALAETHCLVLDVAMPGMNGPELQLELKRHRCIPIIFISANAAQTLAARVLAQGASAFLRKPFNERE